MNEKTLTQTLRYLLLFVLTVVILYFGKPFLVPLVFAALLSMLLLPMAEKLIAKGWNKGVAILTCIMVLLLAIAIIVSVLGWQISGLSKDVPRIEQNVTAAVDKVKAVISDKTGISFDESKPAESVASPESSTGLLTTVLASIGGFVTNFVLVLVYVFLFLYYRNRLRNFLLTLVPSSDEENARRIVDDSRKVAQKYLSGLAMMIACLWVMYSIGFSIAGVENPIFFAILSGTLEIVPFVGNLVGSLLTAGFALAQGGGLSVALSVLIVYGTVQFLQTYLLEPLVVGRGVNINPLTTIVGLVLMEFLWGIPGMVLAIPLLGITKIVCDHIESLKPYADLIGDHATEKKKLFGRRRKRKSDT